MDKYITSLKIFSISVLNFAFIVGIFYAAKYINHWFVWLFGTLYGLLMFMYWAGWTAKHLPINKKEEE